MDSVCVDLLCDFNIIINNKRNTVLFAKLLYLERFLKEMLFIKILFTKLNEGCTALYSFLNLLIKSFITEPVTVSNSIEQKVLGFTVAVIIEFHILLLFQVHHRSYCISRQ